MGSDATAGEPGAELQLPLFSSSPAEDMYCARSLTRTLKIVLARVPEIDTCDRATIRSPCPVHSPVSWRSVQW